MEQAQMISKIHWETDPEASTIEFRIRHLLSYITGVFRDFMIEVRTEGENFATAQIRFACELSSVDINDEERKRQINSLELLHNEKFSRLKFNSSRIEKISEHRFTAFGNLKLFNVERPIALDMLLDGLTRTPGDHLSAAFSLSGKFKYTDFTDGIEELKTASLFIGKEVALTIRVKLEKPRGSGNGLSYTSKVI